MKISQVGVNLRGVVTNCELDTPPARAKLLVILPVRSLGDLSARYLASENAKVRGATAPRNAATFKFTLVCDLMAWFIS